MNYQIKDWARVRIGVICPNFPPATFEGGVSHYSEILTKNLLALGHKIYAFTSTEFIKPTGEANVWPGLKTISIEGPWVGASVLKIKKISIQKRIDVLILQYAPASFGNSFRIAWALTKFPCQKITSFHTLWGRGFDRVLGIMVLYGSSKIIATNSEIMCLLERHFPSLLNRTYWIPIGSNILPSRQYITPNRLYDSLICYFGMLYPGKGLELILDTLEELKRKGVRYTFKFIGDGIIYFNTYTNLFLRSIQRRRLDDEVEWLGQLPADDVSEWLSKSRFVFLPYEKGLSDRRGSFMAAIAHGKAVLTSPPIVPMEFLKNGINVIWPNENSLPAYTEMAARLLRDDEIVARLQNGAYDLYQRFRWEKIAKEYELVARHG